MDIRQCYETLELNSDASIEDVKQAYKDLVNIWHPDRVSNNPRLKQKAEEKLKQINAAHEGLLSYLNSQQKGPVAVEKAPRPEYAEENTAHQEARANTDGADRPKTRINTGAGIVSTLWSYLSDLLHSLSNSHVTPRAGMGAEPYSSHAEQGYRQDRDMGRGTGTGRGRGMRKGGRGKGRGKHMGMGRGRR